MNKKQLYQKKIEIIKDFLKANGNIEILEKSQLERKEVLEKEKQRGGK